jgi:hypothetical protein
LQRSSVQAEADIMAKQMINVSGEDVNVREDTAKAYRGVYWALLSIAAFVIITAVLFFSGFFAWLIGPTHNAPVTSNGSQFSGNR